MQIRQQLKVRRKRKRSAIKLVRLLKMKRLHPYKSKIILKVLSH